MTKSPFIVYILPIILSVSLGALVMAEALKDPERELNMWQFEGATSLKQQGQLSIIGLEKNYSTSDQIQLEIKVSDSNFEALVDRAMVIFLNKERKKIASEGNLYMDLNDKIYSWVNKQVRLSSLLPTPTGSQSDQNLITADQLK